MPTWIFGIIFLVLFALVLLVVSFGFRISEGQRKKKVGEVLRQAAGLGLKLPESSIMKEADDSESWDSLLSVLPLYKRVERNLKMAALDTPPAVVLVAMAALAAVGVFLGLRIQAPVLREAAGLGLGIGGGLLPYLWVSLKVRQRISAFEELFPEALDFLARSMRAGHAFSVSLEMMAEETPDPVGTEFRKVFHEQNLGASLETTLKNFAERMPLIDTKFFVSAVLLQRETGGNLAEILTKLSYIIRERFRLKGQVKAASAHGRITAVILSVMPLVTLVLLNIIAPEYFSYMVEDKDGRWIVLAVLVLQITGYCWMRKIINIKV